MDLSKPFGISKSLTQKIIFHKPPPKEALDVSKWSDLPSAENPYRYRIERDGRRNQIRVVANKNRRVLAGLLNGPIFSASRARISNCKSALLKSGFDIVCHEHHWEVGGESKIVGVYHLRDVITPMGEVKKKRGFK